MARFSEVWKVKSHIEIMVINDGGRRMDILEWLVMYGFPLVIAALVVRWFRLIKNNTDVQVEQNKEIISILKEIQTKKEKSF